MASAKSISRSTATRPLLYPWKISDETIISAITCFDLHFVARTFIRLFSDGVDRDLIIVLFFREELRRRFVKAETTLFKVRYEMDAQTERKAFLDTHEFEWEKVARRAFVSLLALKRHDRSRKMKWISSRKS